jgi:TRAP-type C4-dicarboxylate transport system substrate-binding protein
VNSFMRKSRPAGRTSWRAVAAIASVATLVAIAGCGGSANPSGDSEPDEVITIRYTSVGATGSEIMDQTQWFADQVEERTGGRVRFELFLDGSLVGAAETLPAVLDGRADAGYLCDCYAPNEFPVWSLFSTPFAGNNAEAFMLTAMELYQAGGLLTDEFAQVGVHANWFHTIGAGLTYMREPISSVEDLRGMRLRAIGLTAEAFAAAGAEPVAMDPGEIYESVQRGAIDGVGTFFFPSAHAFGIHEVAPHVGDPGTGFYASVGFIMNADVWASLPDDIQQVFDEVSEELMSGVAIDIYERASSKACDAFLDAGGSVTLFPADDLAAWQEEVLPGMLEAWKDRVVAKYGVDRAQVEQFYDTYTGTLARHVANSDHVPDAEACASR